jgi:uncharacterized membrane protein YphA (DoxX/SURF4 family)
MLVILRLALGWHFLYEGIWKYNHRDAFMAETEGFLSAARGPAAGYIYDLVPDIDGHQRLERDLEPIELKGVRNAEGTIELKDGKNTVKVPSLAKRWDELTKTFVAYYRPGRGKDDDELYKQFITASNQVWQRNVRGLEGFIKDNGDKIKAHFESLERYREQVKADPSTDFMRQRRWDQMQEYRKEAKGWCADLDAREKALKADLMDLLNKNRMAEVANVAAADAKDKAAKEKTARAAGAKNAGGDESKPSTPVKSTAETKPSDPPKDPSDEPKKTTKDKKEKSKEKATAKTDAKSKPVTDSTVVLVDFSPLAADRDPAGPFRRSSNFFQWPRTEQMAFLMTYVFLAIGACLMLGLFTRPAALGGAAFMLFVVLCQPSFPGVYPTDPPQLGHALLVNKDFIEMIALLVIASTSMGRWTGMDYFLCKCCGCGKGEKS